MTRHPERWLGTKTYLQQTEHTVKPTAQYYLHITYAYIQALETLEPNHLPCLNSLTHRWQMASNSISSALATLHHTSFSLHMQIN